MFYSLNIFHLQNCTRNRCNYEGAERLQTVFFKSSQVYYNFLLFLLRTSYIFVVTPLRLCGKISSMIKAASFRSVPASFPCTTKTKEPLKTKGSGAETEGFEPSYRDEPINAFRVRRVTAASLRLQDVCLFKKGRLYIIIHIFSDLYREITK